MKNKIVFALVALTAGLLGGPAANAQEMTCSTSGGTNCSGTIPDFPINASYTSTMTVAQPLSCAGLTPTGMGIRVNLVHPNVGDLRISVTGPAGTTTLLNQPAGSGGAGGCAGEDILAIFGPSGLTPNTCQEVSIPAITGSVAATGPGIGFLQAPVSMVGNWQLTVTDLNNGAEGLVQDWGLVPVCPTIDVPAQSPAGMLATILFVMSLGFLAMRSRRRQR